MQRRAAWRDDADELRDAAGAGFLIEEQLEGAVTGRNRFLIRFAQGAQRFGVERQGANRFGRLPVVFGTAHADDDQPAVAVYLGGACGRQLTRRAWRQR